MDFIYIVAIIFLFVKVLRVSERVSHLEKRYGHSPLKEKDHVEVPIVRSETKTETEAQQPAQVTNPELAARMARAQKKFGGATQAASLPKREAQSDQESFDPFSLFLAWFKKDWMLKTGALFVLIGMGWFLSYAIMQGWIGEVGRITLGYVFGTGIMAFGWKKMHDKEFVKKAAIFFVLGATIILLTTYAARSLYDMFPSAVALLVMFLTSMFVSLSSVRFLPSLSIIGLAMAGIAPLLTHSSSGDYILLFAYLLVVILGSHVVVHLTGRRESIFAGLVMISLYSAPYIGGFLSAYPDPFTANVDKGILLLFAYAFTAIFFLASIIGIIRSAKIKEYAPLMLDVLTACGTGLFLLVWVLSAGAKDAQALILIAWSLVFTVGAFLLYKISEIRLPFYAYSLVSLVLIGTATSLLLDGDTLTIAFTLESLVVVLGAHYLLKDREVTKALSCTFVLPIVLCLSGAQNGELYLGSWSLAAHFLVASLFGAALAIYFTEEKDGSKNLALFDALSVISSIVLAIVTSSILSRTDLIIAYTIQGTVLILGTRSLKKTESSLVKMSFYFALPFITMMSHIDEGRTLFDQWSNASMYLAATLFALGLIFFFDQKKKNSTDFKLFNNYALYSVIVLGLVIWADLSGSARIIAYSFEAFAVILVTLFLTKSEAAAKLMTGLFAVPIITSLPMLLEPARSVFDTDSIALLILASALLVVSYFVYLGEEGKQEKKYLFFTLYLSVGSIYFWIVVWRTLHALFAGTSGTVSSLIVFTISGLLIYGYGFIRGSKGIKLYGTILVGFVIARLLLVDVWDMTLIGKVITFLVVGALLMGTAFLRKKE